MKNKILKGLITLSFIFSAAAMAQEGAPAAHDHSQKDAASSPAKKEGEGHGMMGGMMDKDHMQGMMKECMANHKDGKMCGDQMMEKCQAKMSKMDCQAMMKKMKK